MSATSQNSPNDGIGLTELEQLAALRAVAGGNAAAIAALGKRLAGLCDLLDLELEDAPGAELYLDDAKAAASQIGLLAQRLSLAAAAPVDALEPINLHTLIRAADDRLRRINRSGYQLAAEPATTTLIRGDLFLLQQSLLELPVLFAPDQAIAVDFATTTIDGSTGIAVAFGATVNAIIADAVQLFEKPAPDAQREFLAELAGVAAVHGGKALTRKHDPAGYLLFFPTPAQAKGYDYDNVNAVRGTETVLLVDDENMIWDVVIDMLQSLGYTVILAGNGKECVEVYRDNPGVIDLVLLDMIMPEMNGREAFHELKKIDPKVRVLLQSGYVAEDEARDVLDSGACGFLRKPYRMVDLAARIREVMK